MRKKGIYSISAALFLLLYFASPVAAQRIEIIPFAGYQTSAKINAYQGYFRVNDGMDFGASIALGRNAYKIELSYSRQGSSLTYFPDDNTDPTITDLAVHYASIGGLLEFFQGDPIVPFFKVALGGTYYQPINSETTTENVMHFNFSGGAKLYLNEHFGFRFQASLLLPVFFEGQYFEEAAPASGEGMKTKIGGVQGDFTTGIIFRF
jgi:hypothetical protein